MSTHGTITATSTTHETASKRLRNQKPSSGQRRELGDVEGDVGARDVQEHGQRAERERRAEEAEAARLRERQRQPDHREGRRDQDDRR